MTTESEIDIQVTRRHDPLKHSLDWLPPELEEYASSKGRHLRLGSTNPMQQAKDQALGFEAILYSELTPQMQSVVRGRFVVQEDRITLCDMLLQWRLLRDRAYMDEMELERRRALEDPKVFIEQMGETMSGLRREATEGTPVDHGKPAKVVSHGLKSAREHFFGGPAAIDAGVTAEDVKEAVKAAKERKLREGEAEETQGDGS